MHEIGIDPIAIRADFNIDLRRPRREVQLVDLRYDCHQLCRACLIFAFMSARRMAPGTNSSPMTKQGFPLPQVCPPIRSDA
jgi:hypothetical protein